MLTAIEAEPLTAASLLPHMVTVLEQQFGKQFELWRPDGQPLCTRGDIPADLWCRESQNHAQIVELVRTSHAAGRPIVASADESCQILAVPLANEDGTDLVLVAKFRHFSAELLRRHAEVILEKERLQREVSQRNEEINSLVAQVAQSYEELTFIRRMAAHTAVPETSSLPVEILSRVLPELRTVLEAESLVLFLEPALSPHENADAARTNDHFRWAGRRLLDERQCQHLIATYRESAASRPVVKNQFGTSPEGPLYPGLREFVLLELRSHGRLCGWLIACNQVTDHLDSPPYVPDGFTSTEVTMLASAASMLAASFHNLELLRQKEQLFTDVVRALVNAMDARDPYTCGHSERVAILARWLGQKAGFGRQDAERLYLSGLLHDAGKLAVPDSLLQKPTPLSDEEQVIFARHPDTGWTILHELAALQRVLPGVLHHHERYDGSGYPDHLVGDEIPLDARIVSVCDGYDAMATDRPYRQGMTSERAASILRKGAGTQWDPDLVSAFLSAMPELAAVRRQFRHRILVDRQRLPKST